MRFWISGPRVFGIRPGVSWGASEFYRGRRASAVPRTGGYVYVIEGAHGHQKIGWSSDPARRRSNLQTGSPVILTVRHVVFAGDFAEQVERVAHRILGPRRLPGEWFDVSPETAIAAIYSAAATLGVGLNGDMPDAVEDDFSRRLRWANRIKWTIFVIGMALMGVGIRWIVNHPTS